MNSGNHTNRIRFFISIIFFYFQILQTGQEIMELDHSGFSTQTPTIFAGNIGNNRYIVQVSPMGVRLLEGGNFGINFPKILTFVIIIIFFFFLLNRYPFGANLN